MVIRYAIRMKNGGFMKQEFENNLDRIKITSVDNPIDADLLKSKDVAVRCTKEILSGNTAILVLYDDFNPPIEVIELEIDVRVKNIFK